MLKYQIYQSQLKGSTAYGKWYCRIVSTKTMNVAEVAEHMHAHHTPFSSGTISGIITDAVKCTKELLLEGKKVYWDNLASFGLSVEHNYGAATADEFSVAKNVKNVKLTAQGVGDFSKNILSGKATLREAKDYLSPKNNPSEGTPGESQPQNTCKVELTATTGGSVEGAGLYTIGSRITIKAIANPGYHFVKWSDEDTNATRNITVSDNISLTATFEADSAGGGNPGGSEPQNTCKVELTATAGGSVEGAGSYSVGSRITIKAIANAGYHFVKWSDEDTNATRNITVSENISLTATFEADSAGGGNPGGGSDIPDVE